MTADVILAETLTYEDHEQMAIYKNHFFRPELITPPLVTYRWYMHNKDTCVAARDMATGKIVAHLNILPISGDLYAAFRGGNCDDTNIPLRSIKKYDKSGEYLIYLCSLAVDPRYHGTSALRLLVNAYIEVFHRLARRGILISEVIADAVTEQGVRICGIFGLRPGSASRHHSTLFSAPAPEFVGNIGRLVKSERLTELYDGYYRMPAVPDRLDSTLG